MKSHSTRNPLVSRKNKVMPLAAFAFFLCLTISQAQDNVTTGDVYENTYNRASIRTEKAGTSDLVVLNPDSFEITIDKTVNGFITISNSFSSFDILATDGILTGSNTTTLSVLGGTNLTIEGGTFSGGTLELDSNTWARSEGALLSNVQTALVSKTTFEGKTVSSDDSGSTTPPGTGGSKTPSNASGSSALVIENGTYAELNDVTIKGGHAGFAQSQNKNVFADGGTGLIVYDSTVILSNATITGGDGGNATAYNDYKGRALGGNAIYASNSVIEIQSGKFNGGYAGSASGSTPIGGSGLFAVDGSSITISNGTFNGAGTADVLLQNSALTTYGGKFTNGGLQSQTSGSATNNLNLQGGDFRSLVFINNSTNGMQFVTTTNIFITEDVYQDGGTVVITNLDDNAFQNITINDGNMIFTEDLTMNSNAKLFLSGTGSKAFFQGLEIGTDAEVDVRLGQLEAEGDIDVAGGAKLKFLVIDGQYGTITSTGGSVSLTSNSTVSVDAVLAGFSTGTDTVTVIQATSQISTNFISDVKLTDNPDIDGRTTLDETIIGNDLSYVFATLPLEEYWEATGDLAILANELEDLASSEMNAVINNLGATESKALVEETYLTTMNTFQVAKQGLDAAVGIALSRGTEFREQLRLPKGTKGPELENDWRFWAKYYGQFYHRDKDGLNPEYDAIMHGGVFGMDKSFGNLLLGISGGAGRYSIEDSYDSEQDMNAYQAALYSTYGKEHAYLEAGLGFGMNSVESETTDPLSLEADFDTQLASAYLGGGYGFEIPGISTVITPEAAVRYTMYQQDAYEETSDIAVPRSFDEFDADSLTGSLGLNAAMLNTTAMEKFSFKLEGRAHWIREFNPDPGDISFQLVGGSYDYLIAYPYLDEDTIRLGFGFTFFNTGKRAKNNILLRLDFDELLGEDFNSHNLSAKAIFAF